MSDVLRRLGVHSKTRLVLRGMLILMAAGAVWLWLASVPTLYGITVFGIGDVGILIVEKDGWHYWAGSGSGPFIRHWQLLSMIAIVFGVTYLHRKRRDASGVGFPLIVRERASGVPRNFTR